MCFKTTTYRRNSMVIIIICCCSGDVGGQFDEGGVSRCFECCSREERTYPEALPLLNYCCVDWNGIFWYYLYKFILLNECLSAYDTYRSIQSYSIYNNIYSIVYNTIVISFIRYPFMGKESLHVKAWNIPVFVYFPIVETRAVNTCDVIF